MPSPSIDSFNSEVLSITPRAATDTNLITFRECLPTDKNFIYSTWLKGLYYGNEWFREIPKEIYFDYYSKLIQYVLSKPGVFITAACLEDDPEVILGYSVLEKRNQGVTLHWVFVKKSWRKIGIAKNLIPDEVDIVSHLTKFGRALKPREWKFIPFLT